MKENIEKAYIQGFEAAFSWRPWNYFEITSGITTTYGQNITKNESLRRIPPLNGRMAGTYRFGKFFYSAEFLFASKQDRLSQGDIDDNRISDDGTPGWQVINLFAGYRIKSLRLNAGLQNIFDEDYRMHGSGINGIGRSAWLSLCYTL